MASFYWIKLWHEILDDSKMARLSDELWRKTVELFLIAGETQQDGLLPPIGDIAWRLHVSEDDLERELDELAEIGIVTIDDDELLVTNFERRQAAQTGAERTQRHRELKHKQQYYGDELVTEDVTICYTEEEKEVEVEEEQNEKKTNPLRDFYSELTTTWHNYYPDKRQYGYDTVKAKIAARYIHAGFREHWQEALRMSCNVKALRDEGWFSFEYLIRNDTNYLKLLDGTFAFKDGDKRTDAPKPAKPIDCDDATAFFRGEG